MYNLTKSVQCSKLFFFYPFLIHKNASHTLWRIIATGDMSNESYISVLLAINHILFTKKKTYVHWGVWMSFNLWKQNPEKVNEWLVWFREKYENLNFLGVFKCQRFLSGESEKARLQFIKKDRYIFQKKCYKFAVWFTFINYFQCSYFDN